MKKLLLILLVLFWASTAFAQAPWCAVRNDSEATVVCGANGDPCALAVDDNGRLAGVYAEDVASSSGDSGFYVLSIRDDVLADGGHGDTDGDKQPIVTDEYGRTWTNTALQSDILLSDGTPLTPKFKQITTAAADNTIVAAVATAKIRVLAYVIICSGAETIRFEDGAGGTALTGVMSVAANAGVSSPYSPVGLFETSANTILNLETSNTNPCHGHLTYIEAP